MLEINKDNFDVEVKQADKPVLLDFWGTNASPASTHACGGKLATKGMETG